MFEHKKDRKLDFKKTTDALATMREQRLKFVDDTYVDVTTVQQFSVFESVTESLMKLVFEEAVSNGFFGLLPTQQHTKSNVQVAKVQAAKQMEEFRPHAVNMKSPAA